MVFLRSLLALALCVLMLWPGPAQAAPGPVLYAEAAILIDGETGQVLYEKNARHQMEPASLTKILTCLMAMEEAAPEERVTVPEEATWLMSDAAAIGLVPGERLTMAQLLYAMMLPSANDAASAVGIHLGGSLSGFSDKMNRRLAELGLKDSHFENPHGLPARNHYATAYDLAQVTREALKHPEFLDYAGSSSYFIPAGPENRGYSFSHLNRTLRRGSEFYDARAIAGKTGWTESAGNCLMTVGEENGRRLIAVVLRGDNDGIGGGAYRDTRALFDYGFSSFRPVTVPLPGEAFLLTLGEGGECQLSGPGGELTFLLPQELELELEDCTLEISREPERVAFGDDAFWGEVVLRDSSGAEVLTAARLPLEGHFLNPAPLGPGREVYVPVEERRVDRGDIPLALGGSGLAVLFLALVNRKKRREAEEKERFWAELDRREGDIFAKIKEEEGLL